MEDSILRTDRLTGYVCSKTHVQGTIGAFSSFLHDSGYGLRFLFLSEETDGEDQSS